MRIIYFIDTMQFGGAARKTTLIANELVRRGHEVYIVTDTNLPIGFTHSPKINILPLYDNGKHFRPRINRVLRKMLRIRHIVSSYSPDIVISVLPHVSLYVKLSLIGKPVPIVFSDETSFARNDNRLFHFIRHSFYNLADTVVVLTNNDIKLLGNNIPQKIAIHNPIEVPKFDNDFSKKKNTILAIGPLEEWDIKGFDLLIQAFSQIATEFPDWNLEIAGNNREPYRTQVMELASKAGISNRIILLGFRKDIYDIMYASSIYALSSRIEGFSLSLVEAISQGCACVAFENYGVINEVTSGGKGVLVVKDGDIAEFAESLRLLMSDDVLRKRLAREGMSCVEQYDIETIVDQWEVTLNNLINKR